MQLQKKKKKTDKVINGATSSYNIIFFFAHTHALQKEQEMWLNNWSVFDNIISIC